jgi:heat shock protein HtpX
MSGKIISYALEAEIPSGYLGNLLDFIYQKYLLPQRERFANISRTMTDGVSSIAYDVLDPRGQRDLRVDVNGIKPIEVNITQLRETVTEQVVDEAKEDVAIAVDFFEEKVRQNSLHFAWREGEEIVPEETSGKEKKSINRLFLETQILLFVIFMSVGMFLFLVIGWIAPVVLMLLQFVFVFYSSKLIERTADWRITKDNPSIHLLEYRLPLEEEEAFRKKYPKEKIAEIKKEVYEQTISKKGEIDCETTGQIFMKHGLKCSPENLATKKVNVYQIVEKTAQKFGFKMPKVVVSNTLVPNAAASGPSPGRGVVLITTGLLAQLDETEILSVLGHEFGHLKGRDPLLLFGLMAGEFLFRFYVLSALFPVLFFSLLFFAYFWAVMTVIYFVAKFFEARADLTSAIVVGQPQVLAEALEKIGFKRLLYERTPSFRIQEWISFDPHPPIYFRVNRLKKLDTAEKIKHPLIQSAREVTKGFLDSL